MTDPKQVIEKYPNQCYVYICYLDDKPIYVGKGVGKRYLHCTSGKSSNVKLNKAFFEYGPEAMRVIIVFYNLMDDVALSLERDLIRSLELQGFSLYNFDKKTYRDTPIGWIFPLHNPHDQSSSIPEWVTEEID